MVAAEDANLDVEQDDHPRRPFPKGSVVLRDRRQARRPGDAAAAVVVAVRDAGGPPPGARAAGRQQKDGLTAGNADAAEATRLEVTVMHTTISDQEEAAKEVTTPGCCRAWCARTTS